MGTIVLWYFYLAWCFRHSLSVPWHGVIAHPIVSTRDEYIGWCLHWCFSGAGTRILWSLSCTHIKLYEIHLFFCRPIHPAVTYINTVVNVRMLELKNCNQHETKIRSNYLSEMIFHCLSQTVHLHFSFIKMSCRTENVLAFRQMAREI